MAAHPYRKARVAPPHHIRDDGDGTNHFVKGGDTPIPPRKHSVKEVEVAMNIKNKLSYISISISISIFRYRYTFRYRYR